MSSVSLSYIVSKIQKQEAILQTQSNAIFNATSIANNSEIIIGNSRVLTLNEKLKRLKPWLKKALAKETTNEKLQYQLNKVHVLAVSSCKYALKLSDTAQKQAIESMMQQKYRFCVDLQEPKRISVVTEEDVQVKLKLI